MKEKSRLIQRGKRESRQDFRVNGKRKRFLIHIAKLVFTKVVPINSYCLEQLLSVPV